MRADEIAAKYAIIPRAPNADTAPTDDFITVDEDGRPATPAACTVCGGEFTDGRSYHTYWPHSGDIMCAGCAASEGADNICSCNDTDAMDWLYDTLGVKPAWW